MIVRKTQPADLEAINETYAYARGFMKETGNPNQWIYHPVPELVREDIRKGLSYALEQDGTLCGVFVMYAGPEPEYTPALQAAGLPTDGYGVIHRIAGNGKARGVLQTAVEKGLSMFPVLCIDTHPDNRVMQGALKKAGFDFVGDIYLRDDTSDHALRRMYRLEKK